MFEPLTRMAGLTGAAALIVTLALAVLGGAPGTSAALFLFATAALWASAIFSARHGGIDFLIAFFFLFFIALPAKVQIAAQTYPWGGRYGAQVLNQSLALCALALLIYLMFRARTAEVQPLAVDPAAMRTGLWAMLAGLAGLFVLLGPGALLVSRGEFGNAAGGLSTQLVYIGRSLSLLALILAVMLHRDAGAGRAVILCAALAALAFNYPPALPRFVLFGCAIAIGALWLDLFQPRVKLALAAFAPPAVFIAFPLAKLISRPGFSWSDLPALAANIEWSAYLLRVDFDAFKQIADTVLYLQEAPLRWGENYLGVVLFFVPRALWPGKPEHTGALVSGQLGYPYTNVSSPLPAEALVAFGIPGLLITFALLGALTARVEQAALSTPRLPQLAIYALMMGFITIILRGSLNGVAPQFGAAFLAWWALTRWSRV